ncbi:thylakoid membrane protein [Quillaja saponaria]|uniref:Thylakoid membrane protein n=1 Tax=Quillaja saponaria TaxID=32244 RepID=A0AAD7VD00_QUISA|nr:thylakoid membrane protein [Quillaja saponaria]
MSIKAVLSAAGEATICFHRQFGHCSLSHVLSLPHPPRLHRSNTGSRPSSSLFLQFQRNGNNFSKTQRLHVGFTPSAADSTQAASVSPSTDANKTTVSDSEFSLAKVSFGVIGLSLGVSLLSYGFGAYFNVLPGSEWSALMLTYGFPLAIIGMALKYAELKPVPCTTFADAENLREACATPILKQVRNDVTRYRYGDEQHLDEALKRIFQYGLGGGIPRRSAPILQMIREEVTEDGKYSLVLVFEAKALQLSDFERRQPKFASFFGPGITAEIGKSERDLYEVRLIANEKPSSSLS